MHRRGRMGGVVAAGLALAVAGCFGGDDGTGPDARVTYSLIRVDREAIPVELGGAGVEVTEGQFIWFTGGAYSFSYILAATEDRTLTTLNRTGRWRVSDDQSDEHLRPFLMKHYGDRYGADSRLPSVLQLELVAPDGSTGRAISQGSWIAIEEADAYFEFKW